MTAILEWGQEDSVFYDVSVVPNVTVRLNGSTSAQLTVSYNITYIVSVVATLCGRSATYVTELHYNGELCYTVQL